MQVELLSHWNNLLDTFPAEMQDVYFKEEYVRLYETDTEKAYCIVCQEDNNILLLPLLRRTFTFEDKKYYDFETTYGYSGPITNSLNEQFRIKALITLKEYCSQSGYIAGLVRFHPLLLNQTGFDTIGQLIPDRKTVAIDLNQTMDRVWTNEIHSKNRNVIRKAENAGCRFIVDESYKYIDEFIKLYNSTMDKLSADDFYYFDDNYYKHLIADVPNSFLGCVTDMNNKIISAAIFMYNGIYGHYHLSGSDKTQLHLSPNNFMLWETAKVLQKKGVKLFHLGGGTTGDPNDTLFLFKHRFSKNTCQFYIGKLIFNQDIYETICTNWEQKNPNKSKQYKNRVLKYKY